MEEEPLGWSGAERLEKSAALGAEVHLRWGVRDSPWGGEEGTYVEWSLKCSRPCLIPAFTALADNHISHNSSLGYMGAVESKASYPALPQVPPARYSPVPRHMLAEEDFTR